MIVISHFGRPKGGPDPQFSLKPVADKLAELLGKPVAFAGDCIGEAAEQGGRGAARRRHRRAGKPALPQGRGEERPRVRHALAALGDIFVNDAFSTAHRAHASTEAIARLLPAYAGPLLMEEIDALRSVLDKPARPTAAVIGGAKVSSKIPVLTNLAAKVDKLIIGGGMANTFLLARGRGDRQVAGGARFRQDGARDHARRQGAQLRGHPAARRRGGAEVRGRRALRTSWPTLETPSDQMILDVGPKTVAHYADVLGRCKTLLWNGPLGAFEIAPFGEGTFALARAAAALTKAGKLISVAGGGDTVAALNAAGVTDEFTYVSTAGGAFLEWLEGRTLPGIAALAHERAKARSGAITCASARWSAAI